MVHTVSRMQITAEHSAAEVLITYQYQVCVQEFGLTRGAASLVEPG